MDGMFFRAKHFNHNINSWDTSSVINMGSMFMEAESFNQPLDKWDTSSVVNMNGMFKDATNFNQALDSWDTSRVEFMFRMFFDAKNFEQKLDSWDISSVRDNQQMFWYSGVKGLPKWWQDKIVGKKLLDDKISADDIKDLFALRDDRVKQEIKQALENPRSKEERQKEKEQKEKAQKQAQQIIQKRRQVKQKAEKPFYKSTLFLCGIGLLIGVGFGVIKSNFKSSTPKQSSAQTQQSPQPKPQETQRFESTNSMQNSAQSTTEPSVESTASNESENVAQNSAQDDTPSESVNLTPSQNTKPSFDCAKANTNAEKLVCSDDELARLDNELANAYKNARNSLDNASKKQLTNEQKSWLKTYNQCTDKECVKYHLQMRIQALQSSGAKAGLRLNTNDEYVNLRRSPSGEILTTIYKSDFGKITLKKLETNGKWIKVLYFAPNATNQDDAIMGYIYISQIDESSL